ncbi:hypothetical protein KUG02_09645 [Streptococcus equi subsp. zooepidemicus]|uniref:Uncharacterized protein n=1 Tax=Streptococcus equi subsp. zooepidemicus TaxID=40041 RepID=A0AAJ1US27_STRSZ|nr:hypothetical protein [Streptococcus equi]KIQ76098.1 hypothetical protein QQ41_03850 [Streptococcus equi subsp. zooepidemicus]MCD3390874.1 hypothetical protein [Streptococcus equi subsp. zooepidemicus]MCD3417790.1 hypothetical protein [Streptococcus equi subsp. zooepidemicus]MCD3422901.1 hypothetical protein [Streptococcus equi subsp. zooepidemicus]MCD3433955.1 hypothetical protein [Streptococcus equi subsp. zooepidemicus]
MNKRIKKKKAKQAELKRQQELEQFLQDPEKVRQAFKSVSIAISNMFASLSVAFDNAAKSLQELAKLIDRGGD